MAVPIFEEFLYPFLLATKSKDMTVEGMRKYVTDYFHLSDKDCNLMTKNGSTTQVADRLNWSRQYLRRALMIELPRRGVYRITERGKVYLKTHTSLRRQDLLQYPEFAAYAGATAMIPSGKSAEVLSTKAFDDITAQFKSSVGIQSQLLAKYSTYTI